MTNDILRSYRWFRRQGIGGIVGQDAKNCLDLARAECAAKNAGCYWQWEDDYDGWVDLQSNGGLCSCGCGRKIERCESCILYNEQGESLASLWAIWDADSNYRRIVQAELACDCSDYFTSSYSI